MRLFQLVLPLALALAGRGQAADRIAPEAFAGIYRLVEARQGMFCDDPMLVMIAGSLDRNAPSYVEVEMGAFPFTAVNGGPRKFEDTLEATVTNSYTTADGKLVFESREVDKSNGTVSTEKTVAQLTGTKFHLVSEAHYRYRNGGGTTNTNFECSYRKLAP